jgi:hypothetical protein
VNTWRPSAEQLAVLFHATYERLAPEFGYTTRSDSRLFDRASPNGKLMIAVCDEILNCIDLGIPETTKPSTRGAGEGLDVPDGRD